METTMNPEQMVLSEQIHMLIEQLGGKDNIDSVLPCATRLRIKLKKQPVANAEKLKQQIPSIKYFILLDRYAEIIMDQGLAPAKGIDASNRSFSSERKAKSDRKTIWFDIGNLYADHSAVCRFWYIKRSGCFSDYDWLA